MAAWVRKNWFMLGMPLAVALAWVLPEAGAKGGWLKAEVTTKVAVALVFFCQGLTLPASALKAGAKRWRLHAAVQGYTFVVLPLLGIALDALVGSRLAPDLRVGFLFLAVLPSTIVMSVALTTVANGNVAAAIFNAVLSNVIGVFITPAWVTWLLHATDQVQPLGSVLRQVGLLLLLPLLVGQVLRRVGLETWADARRKALSHTSNAVILLIVYAAFCDSVVARFWSAHRWTTFLTAAVGVVAFLLLALAGAVWLGRRLRFEATDRTGLAFCGAQKTLATGVPLAKLIFGSHPGLGLILLPIMLYHPLQLFICGTLAGRWAGPEPTDPRVTER